MHPAVSLLAQHAAPHQHLLAPLLLVVLGAVAAANSPPHHSLLVAAFAWALIWIPAAVRTGFWSNSGSRRRKTTSWLAGAFLALAHVCDRAACDAAGTWSLKALLPALVVLAAERDGDFLKRRPPSRLPSYRSADDQGNGSDSDSDGDGNGNGDGNGDQGGPGPARQARPRSPLLLAVACVAALMVLATAFTTAPTSALALSSLVFSAAGLVLFEGALRGPRDGSDLPRGLMSANGTFSRRNSLGHAAQKGHQLASLRDFALVMAVVCGLAAYYIEPAISPHTISWGPTYRQVHGDWKTSHYHRTVQQCVLMVVVNIMLNILVFFMLSQQGAVHTSFLVMFSYLCARLGVAPSFSSLWFSLLSGSASLLFLHNFTSPTPSAEFRGPMRFKRIVFGVTAISFGLLLLRSASGSKHPLTTSEIPPLDLLSPNVPLAPIELDLAKGHPADQLTTAAGKEFQSLLNRQSKSLEEAIGEYRRRNGIAPPPHFDKWYEFAVRNRVQLIDEFDTISQSLLPFWGLKPSTIRARVKLALGDEENALIGAMIRDGAVVKVENGQEWQQQATVGMMRDFVQYLPDMDLAFNIHDEPRVVVPHDQLSVLLKKARAEMMPATMKTMSPRNSFSPRPSDLSDGKRFDVVTTSRFNRFAHQQTWTQAALSCPIDSQARHYEDNVADNLTSYAVAPLKYVYNQTAFSDICNSPSFSTSFGFFERPNAFNIIHELTPVFSQSKISSFQDILYPSPWYWFGKVGYDKKHDTAWENKTNRLYWRGSTTGGFSRNGGWRRQHRQNIVKRLNALDKAQILVNSTDGESTPHLKVKEVERQDYEKFIDVKFSHIGQCDKGDCDAQKEFFYVTERVDGQDAWYSKHLLDMDGNAFSGRFYAFLKSKSLTYKMAVFREWHQDWLWPWVHYIPMSLNGTEHLDLVRWFGGGDSQEAKNAEEQVAKKTKPDDNKGGNGDSIGEKKARDIAERSTEWAAKVLRNEDFEAWFFRLLLEYGRIVDDDRDEIGYPGP